MPNIGRRPINRRERMGMMESRAANSCARHRRQQARQIPLPVVGEAEQSAGDRRALWRPSARPAPRRYKRKRGSPRRSLAPQDRERNELLAGNDGHAAPPRRWRARACSRPRCPSSLCDRNHVGRRRVSVSRGRALRRECRRRSRRFASRQSGPRARAPHRHHASRTPRLGRAARLLPGSRTSATAVALRSQRAERLIERSTSPPLANTAAMATRLSMPPESSRGQARSTCERPTRLR